MKEIIKLSPLQKQIYDIIAARDEISIGQIARKVFKDVPKARQPKSINNCITSAIVQINKKCPDLIIGRNYGWQGKYVQLSAISDRIKTTLGSTRV